MAFAGGFGAQSAAVQMGGWKSPSAYTTSQEYDKPQMQWSSAS